MVAGGETTDRALANFWLVLLQHPDVRDELRADPLLTDAASPSSCAAMASSYTRTGS